MPLTTSRASHVFGAALLALGITGCASVPKIELDRSSVARIEKVALLKVPQAPSPHVTNSGGAASAFGLVGALAQVSVNASHGSTYAAAVADRSAALAPEMTASLVDALAKGGYQVVPVEGEPSGVQDHEDIDVSSIRTDADAILAVWFASVGYYSPPRSTTYQPCVVAKARLIDGRSRGDLYFKTFSAGCEPTVKNGVYVPSAERYRYASFGDLMARTPGSEHGLAEATQAIVSQISADLARR